MTSSLINEREPVAELVEQGLPPADAEAFATVIEPIREGTDEYLSNGVQRALGREPRSFAEFAKSTTAARSPGGSFGELR